MRYFLLRMYYTLNPIRSTLILFLLALALLPNHVFAQDITTGLVGHWKFDEGSGTTAADSSGNGNTGTLTNGPTWTTGKIGNAVSLDGTNDYVSAGTSLDIAALPFTLSTWVSPTNFNDYGTIFAKRTTYSSSGMRFNVDLNAGTGQVLLQSASSNILFTYSPPLNVWTHLSIVVQSGSTQLYVNGTLNQTLGGFTLGTGSSAQVRMGNAPDGPDQYAGKLDDVRMYNRILITADIQALYNLGSGPPDTQAPSTPTNLSATAQSSSQINLSWTASMDNVGVTGYRVERCQGAGCSTFAQVATLSSNSYSDTGLSASTSYTYRVRAVDAAGNLSSYSSIASATTQSSTPPPTGTITGLDFPSNGTQTVQFRFTGAALNNMWPATYIWRVRPRQQTGYYTTFFWGTMDNNFNGDVDPYYGAHPYPQGGSSGTAHNWEISTNHNDFINDQNGNNTTVVKDQWYIQALVVEPTGTSDLRMTYYWDLESSANRVIQRTEPSYRNTYPPANPGLVFGDAPWSPGNELLSGVLRGMQIYSTNLALTDILTEAANQSANTPQTATGQSSVWYMNQNPTPTDISDKSGKGHNPAWFTSARPTLYTSGGGDTTPPSVSITAPTAGSTVSGTSVTVFATASDNIGVSGVQFKLDGANLGSEDTTSPYSITWNTTTASNGSHTLTATARDAAGNTTTSSSVTVTVNNGTSDIQAPSTPTNLTATAQSSSQINLSWTASTDNVGVTGYRMERCQGSSCTNFAQIATPLTNSFNDTGLSANTTYRYQVRATDAAGNFSGYSNIASATTQAAPTGTALGNLAASMAPGTWAELTTIGMSRSFLEESSSGGGPGPITVYADSAVWDAVTQRLFFIGSPHIAPYKFIQYSDATNAWSANPCITGIPCSTTFIGHAYDANAMNPVNGDFYYRPYNSNNIYKYSTNSGGAWTLVTSAVPNGTSNCCGAFAYSPELGGLVVVNGFADQLNFFNTTTNQWSALATGLTGMGPYHNFAEYSPVHKIVIFGGGNSSSDVYKLTASGTVTRMANAPFNLGIMYGGLVSVDPVSGNFLVYQTGTTNLWEYNPITDVWRIASSAVPSIFIVGDTYTSAIQAPISTYGVTMWVAYPGAKVYLYKHSASTPPPSDTQVPTASVTAPTAGTTVANTVTISANASDNVGVTNVEFLVDGAVKGSDSTSLYSYSWDTTNGGTHLCNGAHTHTLVARAYDAAGNVGTSANVVVNMNNPSYCSTSTKFVIGDRVQVLSGPLNVRSTPSTSGTLLGTQAAGALGTVTGGPTAADGYNWWNINYDNAPDGWSAEDFLVKYTAGGTIKNATPSNYQTVINGAQPGDTIMLAAGDYNQLYLRNLHGTASAYIIITGPTSGTPAVFHAASCCNTINIGPASYLKLQNFEVDGDGNSASFAVNSDNWSHHIWIENLYIHDQAVRDNGTVVGDNQDTAISTKGPASNWVIRNNRIIAPGIGMYLGSSDQTQDFVGGIVEGNFIVDPIGYGIQIKAQGSARDSVFGTIAGMATGDEKTIIRHNVVIKTRNYGIADRPNLLVGGFPDSGSGSNDRYEIYSNFLYQNPTNECLAQLTGTIAFYDNILFNNVSGCGATFVPHDGKSMKNAWIYNNTILSTGSGISISSPAAGTTQYVTGNAVFAATPVSGGTQSDNITAAFSSASTYLNNPSGTLGSTLDLFPRSGQLTGTTLNRTPFQSFTDWDRDFNGVINNGALRGAYAGSGTNPGWRLATEQKPLPGTTPSPTDTQAPSIPSGLIATAISSSQINLSWTASTDNIGVTGYHVYRGGVQISTATGASYSDIGLSPSTTYSYTVAAYDAAGNVSMQSSSASATTQSGTTPPPSANNTVTIYNTSGSVQTNRPVSIPRPFKQGDISQYAQASISGTNLLTQTDVKNRWPDGSVKFAIVSFIIPNLPTGGLVTVSFSNQSIGNNTGYLTQADMLSSAYNFDGTIQMTGATTQTVSARTMLQNDHYRYWLQGPIVTAVILEDRTLTRTYDKDFGDGSRALHPIYEAWFYPQNNQVDMGYTMENTWSSTTASKSMRDQTYSLVLTAGNTSPTTKFTEASFTHIGKSRWHKRYWIGNSPGAIRVNHNLAYLASTKMIPNYDTGLTVAESLISSHYTSWLNSDKTLDGGTSGVGNYDKVLASAGQHDWIGLGNTWDILYLFTMDDRMLEKSLGNADLGGRVPFHYREADTLAGNGNYFDAAGTVDTFGRPVSIDARKTVTLADLSQTCTTSADPDLINTGAITDGGWNGYNMGRHHFPDFAYIPYLMTGRYYYLEEEQMLASYMLAYGTGCTFESWMRQGAAGYFSDGETRGNAWAYRSTAYAAVISPDGSPEKSYYEDKLLNNIALDEGRLGLPCSITVKQTHCTWGQNNRRYTTGPSPLGLWWEGNSGLVGNPVATNGSVKQGYAPWQQHFIVQVLGSARDFGYPTDGLLRFIAPFMFNQLVNPQTSPYLIEVYLYPTILTATNDWIQTWSAVSNYITVPSGWSLGQDVDQGYGFLALAASSFLYNYSAGGYTGQQAWNFIKANKPEQNLFATVSPKQAILPRIGITTPSPTILVGDLNLDRTVNGLDWGIMAGVWFTSDATADLNKDGLVNSIDFSLMNQNWGRTI